MIPYFLRYFSFLMDQDKILTVGGNVVLLMLLNVNRVNTALRIYKELKVLELFLLFSAVVFSLNQYFLLVVVLMSLWWLYSCNLLRSLLLR